MRSKIGSRSHSSLPPTIIQTYNTYPKKKKKDFFFQLFITIVQYKGQPKDEMNGHGLYRAPPLTSSESECAHTHTEYTVIKFEERDEALEKL